MERRQINAPAAKLLGTVAMLNIYIGNTDVIKERERKRTVDDKGEREHGCNKGERKKEPWMIKKREGKRTMDDKGGSERKSHSPITAVE